MKYRMTYEEIRLSLLEYLYDYCQLSISDRENKQIEREYLHWLEYAWERVKNNYSTPVENLMLHVLMIIISADQLPEKEAWHRECINDILLNNNVKDLIDNLPEKERICFVGDLKILDIISS